MSRQGIIDEAKIVTRVFGRQLTMYLNLFSPVFIYISHQLVYVYIAFKCHIIQ